jgi:hypothetical protein
MICIYAQYTQNILSSENFPVKKLLSGGGKVAHKIYTDVKMIK